MEALKLDETGNIDSRGLESELQAALEFDVKYRQQDNMKKRAVKQAPSYDDFKNMVACAHLKKVTREEVESLSAPKKGWIKSSGTRDHTGTAAILEDELRTQERSSVFNRDTHAAAAAAIKSSAARVPKTTVELARDLRRCCSMSAKVDFLAQIGLKKTKPIFKKDIDAEFLEELLRIVISSEGEAREALGVSEKEKGEEEADAAEEKEKVKTFTRIKWLKALSGVNSFALLIKFTAKEVLEPVLSFLAHKEEQELLSKFTC